MTQSVDTEVATSEGTTDDLNVEFRQLQWMGQIAKSFH